MDQQKAKDKGGAPKKRLWPWLVLLVLVIGGIYAYERVEQFLSDNGDILPFMLFDFILQFFLEDAPREGLREV